MSRRRADDDFVTGDDEVLYDEDDVIDRSDEDDDSDDAAISRLRRGRGAAGRGAASGTGNARTRDKGKGKAWEGQFERTWDQVQEDEEGTLEGAVSTLLLTGKSRRILRDTASIQRGIIRHVYLVIDLSTAMLVRDYKVTWLELTLKYAQDFITEFFDQNPIGQMAIMITRDGLAERLTPLSGNPADHLKALQNKKKMEARGAPSLQNVLQLAKTGLGYMPPFTRGLASPTHSPLDRRHLPPHGSREVIIILGSLTSCDPTNIHQTIKETEAERIRVNIIGLTADMKICRDICEQTKARDDEAFRDLLFEFVSPPPTLAPSKSHVLGGPSPAPPTSAADLMQMGFPTLLHSTYPGICSCHNKLKTAGYSCPRCKSRICDVPTECRVCGLTVVNAPQLARSYRHLFPVANYERVLQPSPTDPPACFSCSFPFKALSSTLPATQLGDLSPLGRYRCPKCARDFCLDCDKLVHDALGFCPGVDKGEEEEEVSVA
ncbi:SPOSA6832_03372 [Sporobolomyces salmonicolor]|uniref:General transcription and DNA repair factor IIH n=1 Tax=Sporidiobolus salmonicolor TaxID=5005 RepID=A0A0D6EQ01_SPOSA|nr:SPOSA6832_03372 [Sporobolomyces salmonicolor]